MWFIILLLMDLPIDKGHYIVNVTGTLDLEPNWLFSRFFDEYNQQKDYNEFTTRKYQDEENNKNTDLIKDFTNIVYKDSVQIFNSLNENTHNEVMKRKIIQAQESYRKLFREYLKGLTQENKPLNTKETILRTINASNKILRNLENDIQEHWQITQGKDNDKIIEAEEIKFLKELVDNEVRSEYVLACQMFDACTTGRELQEKQTPEKKLEPSFRQLITDCLEKALKTNEFRLRKFHEAVTDAIRFIDFTQVVSVPLHHKLQIQNTLLMNIKTLDIRHAYELMLRQLKSGDRSPVEIRSQTGVAKEPLAILEFIDEVNSRLPPSHNMMEQWTDMKIIVFEWAEGHREDIRDIAFFFIQHAIRNAIRM